MPLNVITCVSLYCLHKNSGPESSGHTYSSQNAFIFNTILGLIGLVGALLFWKTFVMEIKLSYNDISNDDSIFDDNTDEDSCEKVQIVH